MCYKLEKSIFTTLALRCIWVLSPILGKRGSIWFGTHFENMCFSGIVLEVLRFGKNLKNCRIFRWLHLPLNILLPKHVKKIFICLDDLYNIFNFFVQEIMIMSNACHGDEKFYYTFEKMLIENVVAACYQFCISIGI